MVCGRYLEREAGIQAGLEASTQTGEAPPAGLGN